jgi:hypothetical protein
VERREHGHARRLEPHLDVAGRFRLRLPQSVEDRPRGPDNDPGFAGLKLRNVALADLADDEQPLRGLLLHAALFRLVQREHRIGAAVLFERDVDAGELAARRFDDEVERRRLADEFLRLSKLDAGALGAPRPQPGAAEHEREDHKEGEKFGKQAF